jgi:uncharacterized repeat protein (TIGR03803 family)
MKSKLLFTISSLGLLAQLATPVAAVAQRTPKYTVLHTFKGEDGAIPYGQLISDDEGNLYGTTIAGGDTTDTPCANSPFGLGCGVVYKIDGHGNESVLHTFKGGSGGAYPATELLRDKEGNLYGTARGGGNQNSACAFTNGCGVIYKLDSHGKASILYAFQGSADGYGVSSGLIRDEAGNFYGVTVAGGISNATCTGDGPPGSCGVVFKLDPKGNETVLHAFTAGKDGYAPYGSLIRDRLGNLHGAATSGGDTTSEFCGVTVANLFGSHGCGTVFKIDQSGDFSVVHTFKGPDGLFPDGWFAPGYAGHFYGVTGNGGNLSDCGGAGCGTIFEIDHHGNESVLYSFKGADDGASPLGSVIRDFDDNLYTTTLLGGDTTDPGCTKGGCGTVFELDRWGHGSVLHTFTGGKDGFNPEASPVIDKEGNLYGTTTAGGDPTCNCGLVFKIAHRD